MAENGFPEIGRLIIFVLGVFLMRSAGCIINDIVDKETIEAPSQSKIKIPIIGASNIMRAENNLKKQ